MECIAGAAIIIALVFMPVGILGSLIPNSIVFVGCIIAAKILHNYLGVDGFPDDSQNMSFIIIGS